ncbi:MAG: AI-2E family transporter [Armatimonadetes bacterium]|nr:AI-2E family transporter [Armatimonadota bacterium]
MTEPFPKDRKYFFYILITTALFLFLVFKIRSLLPLFIVVIIVAYALKPLVDWIHDRIKGVRLWKIELGRGQAILVTYLCIFLILVAASSLIVPQLQHEIGTLAQNLPSYASKAKGLVLEYQEKYFLPLPDPVRLRISQALEELGAYAAGVLKQTFGMVASVLSAVLNLLFALVMVPLLTFYLLKDREVFLDGFLSVVPQKYRDDAKGLLSQTNGALESFIRGQLVLCLVIGVVTTLAMVLVLPEYALALGLIAGVTEAIPIFGPILGAIPAVFIALVKKPILALVVIAIYVGIQQLENTILVPHIMGHELGLHPLTLVVTLLVFGELFGIWGVFVAAPSAAIIKVLIQYIVRKMEISHAPG